MNPDYIPRCPVCDKGMHVKREWCGNRLWGCVDAYGKTHIQEAHRKGFFVPLLHADER